MSEDTVKLLIETNAAIVQGIGLIAAALLEISGHLVNTNIELDRIAETLEEQTSNQK